MATKAQLKQENEDFAGEFNAEHTAPTEQSEDAAFGISPEVSADTDSGEGTAPITTVDATPEGEEPAAVESAEPAAEEAAETPADESAEVATAEPEMTQNEKTWEGRLRKREEELAARESALNTGPIAEDSPEAEAAEATAGDMTADAAMKQLSEDFGPEFVSMIVAIAKGSAAEVATEGVSGVSRNVEGIISHLKDEGERRHFETISAMHPDFLDVNDSPEFAAFLSGRPADGQAEDQRILASGTAGEINGLLTAFKSHATNDGTKTGDGLDGGEDGGAADDAEGVRSGGIELPTTPGSSEDFEAAWEQA